MFVVVCLFFSMISDKHSLCEIHPVTKYSNKMHFLFLVPRHINVGFGSKYEVLSIPSGLSPFTYLHCIVLFFVLFFSTGTGKHTSDRPLKANYSQINAANTSKSYLKKDLAGMG